MKVMYRQHSGSTGETEQDARQQRCGTGVWGSFLQLSIIDVDSRRGSAAFPQALLFGVHCRLPTLLSVVWDRLEHVLSPHMDSCRSHCPWELPPGSQTQAEVGAGAQVMARAVHCHHWML